MGLEHADGEGQRGVHGHDPQQLFAQSNFVRCQLFAENNVPVPRQQKADGQHQRPQHHIGDEKHPVELGHALFVVFGLGAGVVADVGAAQPEAQQIQIRDDGQHGLVHAELAVAQPLDHNGRIHQRNDGAQPHGQIG